MDARREVVEHFVRDVLGCECPDSVFDTIHVRTDARELGGIALRTAIDVGGRLLFCVAESDDAERISRSLDDVFRAGRAIRDRDGLHRFRLVIATDDAAAALPVLATAFENLHGKDDRQHLHVVERDDARDLPTPDPPGS